MAIYSQLSLAKQTLNWLFTVNCHKWKNVKMAIYSQNGYYLSYNTGKKLFYHLSCWKYEALFFSDILAYSAFHGLHF